MEKLNKYTEYECKYNTDMKDLNLFKMLVEKQCGPMTLYCEGPDTYYSKPGTDDFKRFRHASYPKGLRKEITTKVKPDGAKNNNKRIEKNLDVTNNQNDLIVQTIMDDGYEFNFEIVKFCHIYKLEDATLVFYTVVDVTPGTKFNERSFIEIEVSEESIGEMTEEQAMQIIEKYEKVLEPVGIHAQKRIRKSLWEMYKR